MKVYFLLVISIAIFGCSEIQKNEGGLVQTQGQAGSIKSVDWKIVDTIDVDIINSDLDPSLLTVDVGIYFPSNLDPGFDRVSLARVIEGFISAKEIYYGTGVQLNLLWVKTGSVNPDFLSINSSEIPDIPGSDYVNMYINMRRHPSKLTEETKMAFESIIEPDKDNHRTIYLITLQEVFFPFYEQVEGERNWVVKYVRTSALSFPPYIHGNSIPERMAGVITLSNLSQPEKESQKVIAHEIGHKIINVSHEYLTIDPGHEVFGEGGLMIYGAGLDIPSGEEGRWQAERLLLSPFLYRLNEKGEKVWNPDYIEGGHYYDPIYGDYVVQF